MIEQNTNYEKEQKIKDKLKEEMVYITQNNLKKSVEKYEEFVDKLFEKQFYKKRDQIRDLAAKKSKESIESKKLIDKTKNEQQVMQESNKYMKDMIKIKFEKMFNEELKKFQEGIDEIFSTEGIDKNIKSIYKDLNSDEYDVEKIKEDKEKNIKKFEEVYQDYLLTKMQYQEELEICNRRNEQKLKENIDYKKEYKDINNYLDNFKIDDKEREQIRRLDDLIDSL